MFFRNVVKKWLLISSLLIVLSAQMVLAENAFVFENVIDDGFGDRFNLYAWSMQVFNDHLFVGTFNEVNGGQIWRYDGNSWQNVLYQCASLTGNTGFRNLIVFRGYLYAGSMNEKCGAELWRSPDGSQWEQVISGGYGNAFNISIRGAAVFGEHLYIGLQNQAGEGCHLWRSSDGVYWESVTSDGFGDVTNQSIHDMIVYRRKLYVGTKNDTRLQILRSSDGLTYETVVGPDAEWKEGFGIPHNANVQQFFIFRGLLYVGTGNDLFGFSIFRSFDGIHFQPVTMNGMGNDKNMFAWRFYENDNRLWLGTGNFNIPGGEGGSIMISSDGMDWETLVGHDGQYYGYGFNDWRNWGIRTLIEYNDCLYIGTAQCWDDRCEPFVTGLQVWKVSTISP